MFSTWQKEKAALARIAVAQALADKLAAAKPHIRDSQAAWTQVWAVRQAAGGLDLHELAQWPSAAVTRFAASTPAQIAALRKARAYASSDGLTVWLHTAQAVLEPAMLPAVRQIWQLLAATGLNADGMAEDLLQEEGLPSDPPRRVPRGFALEG